MDKGAFSFTWGMAVDGLGYVKLFGFMLDHYAELGIDPIEMMCLTHLARYHYNSPMGESRPSLETIGKQMGRSVRQVRRLVSSLVKKGMLRVKEVPGHPNTYDASPFAEKALALWRAKRDAQ